MKTYENIERYFYSNYLFPNIWMKNLIWRSITHEYFPKVCNENSREKLKKQTVFVPAISLVFILEIGCFIQITEIGF